MRKVLNPVGVIIFLMMMSYGCATVPQAISPPPQQPLLFDEAIRLLSKHLLYQISTDIKESESKQITVAIEPFVDAVSGEIPKFSLQIVNIITEEGKQNYQNFIISPLSSTNADQAHYLIDGTIRLDPAKFYHISAKALNTKLNKVIGTSEVSILEKDLDSSPLAIYKESPLYDPSNRITGKESQMDSIKMKSLLSDAKAAYEAGDYQQALNFFTQALENTDTPGIIIYTGLYLSNLKLGRLDEAEKAFQKLIAVSVEQYKMLTVKFLFEVNSSKFVEDLKSTYEMWLRQIGSYFNNTSLCILIEGHSSCTGNETWNKELSLERARTVQKKMQDSFPTIMKRSRVSGKGSSQNIVGTCSDDQRDALDRRVEIQIVDCK